MAKRISAKEALSPPNVNQKESRRKKQNYRAKMKKRKKLRRSTKKLKSLSIILNLMKNKRKSS